ncbi:UbiD family decarboxylase [Myxococcota bacterium]|nr:UbiD family decarboxylase [Myxococcota bacterium]
MTSPRLDFRSYLDFLACPQLFPLPTAESRGLALCDRSGAFLTAPGPSGFRAAAHLLGDRTRLERFLGVDDLGRALADAMDRPVPPQPGDPATHQERTTFDLRELGAFSLPGLPLSDYLTSAVVFAPAGDGDVNLSIHRARVLDATHLVLRVVPRHLHRLLTAAGGRLRAAIAFGVDPAVSFAASVSLPAPGGELAVAGGLGRAPVTVFSTHGLILPASFECLLIGEFTGQTAPEGPFIDLTGTVDPVREQPVFRTDLMLVREHAVIPMILPSSSEHALLMGLAREAGVGRALRPLYDDEPRVRLSAGGSGWLHCVVSGTSKAPAARIADAAFTAHASCKRLTLIDADLDPDDPVAVEWALATRFQADHDLIVRPGEHGSTLDPSSDAGVTARWVLDARCPPDRDRALFTRLLDL